MLKATDEVPICFGKQFDGTSPECVGGHDPAYYENGSHIRDACVFASSCSVRVQATRNTNKNLIPTSSLLRPPTHFNQPTTPQPYRPPTYATQQQQQHVHGWHPTTGAPQYGIPQYLTIREPVNGRGLGKRLLTEAVRSVGKSLGHTIAHFFDVEVFGHGRDEGR